MSSTVGTTRASTGRSDPPVDALRPAPTCDRCGSAFGVRRVMLMVDGRAMNTHHLCVTDLGKVFDALQGRADE